MSMTVHAKPPHLPFVNPKATGTSQNQRRRWGVLPKDQLVWAVVPAPIAAMGAATTSPVICERTLDFGACDGSDGSSLLEREGWCRGLLLEELMFLILLWLLVFLMGLLLRL
mmetsp:Transcript_51745/g.112478  ORF Transcript_51745/g.112478 Transcript_51745/m.112478 type:complete len:112 (-) Transcript_51745:125-460(-)